MAKDKKKKKAKRAAEVEDDGEQQPMKNENENGAEAMQVDEEVYDPTAPPKVNDDHQKEFKRLGHSDFVETKQIRVVSTWIRHATEFPAAISGDNLCPLGEVNHLLPRALAERISLELKHWFPVQRAVIPSLIADIFEPPVLRRRDIAISAPTGSGKTLCYVLPILAAISRPGAGAVAVVVAPVQNLVEQIVKEFARFNAIGARVEGLSGAEAYEKERRRLFEKGTTTPDVIVATPNRLIEHLLDRAGTLDISRIRFIVADEADRMNNVRQEWLEVVEAFSGGVASQNSSLLDFSLGPSCDSPQKLLLSATLSRDVEQLQKWRLHQPRLFRASTTSAEQIDTSADCMLPSSIKHTMLETQLKYHPLLLFREIRSSSWKRILVFTNERESSVRLCKLLTILAAGAFQVEQLTSTMYGKRRFKALQRFRQGITRVLICSDVLSRGIDVEAVDCVVNYDIPSATRLFIHRAGRTGRAGQRGELLTFAEKEPRRLFMKLLKKGALWREGDTHRVVEAEQEMADELEQYKKALQSMQQEIKAGKK